MPNAHYYLGVALMRSGHAREALQHLRATIQIDPHYALAYFQLGKLYKQLGDELRAQEALRPLWNAHVPAEFSKAEQRREFRNKPGEP